MNSGFIISTDKSKLDIKVIHAFLSNRSYWARGRSLETVQKTIKNSMCFGAYDREDNLVGFARVVTDFAIFAYLMDVFVLEEYRGLGIGKLLVQSIVAHSDLRGVQVWHLDTKDAHGLYEQYGFTEIKDPNTAMEKKQIP